MIYRFAGFSLDPETRLLTREGMPLDVPRRAFDCLLHLLRNRERAVGRDELIEQVWHRGNVSDNQLAQTVLAVRRLLDDDGAQQKLIRTVAGFGYHFVAAVELVETATPIAPSGVETPAPTAAGESAAVSEAVAPLAEAPTPFASEAADVRRWRSPVLLRLGVLVLLLIAAAAALEHWWPVPPAAPSGVTRPAPPPSPAAPAPGWVWVLPARIQAADSEWARVGVATLVAERLRHNGAVVVPMQSVLTRLPGPYSPDQLDELRKELAARQVVAPTVSREGEQWHVELLVRSEAGPMQASVLDKDLLQATQRATDQILSPPAGTGDASNEGLEMITQLIRSREFEAAQRQIVRLPEDAQESPEVELLRIRLEMERGLHSHASLRAAALRARLDAARSPALAGRLGLAEVQLMRHQGQPGWEQRLETSVELLRAHGSPRDLGSALIQSGDRTGNNGDFAAASELYLQARRQFLAAADEVGAARAQERLAQLSMMQGKYAEALPQLQESLAIYRRYHTITPQFTTLRWILNLHFGMLRWADARTSLESMRALLPQGSKDDQREYLRSSAVLLIATGQLREAAALLEEAEHVLGETRSSVQRVAVLYRMQLDLASARYAEVDASGAASFARVSASTEEDSVAARDQREMALYLWFEARRRLNEDRGARPDLPDVAAALETPSTPWGWIAKGHWLRERNAVGPAEAAYREALAPTRPLLRLEAVLAATRALIDLLLDRSRVDAASLSLDQLLVRDATLPQRDYDSALLVARVRRAEGDTAGWRVAIADATRLAGERHLPAELLPPP